MSLSYSTYAPAIIQALNLKKATSEEKTVSEFQISMETSNITVAKTVILSRETAN